MDNPRLEYKTVINDSGDPGYVNRILVGTPTTGSVRVEWVQARTGLMVPVNWSWVTMYEFVNGYMPLRYQVDDAQNLIVDMAIQKDFQWLLFWEHDNIPMPDALIRLNVYMREASHPVVSGLYYTRSIPSEPLIFRGKGTGAYYDWNFGDKIYCDGVPTGFLLVHVGLLKAMWDEAESYMIHGQMIRRVFRTPRDIWHDPETGFYNTISGTSDLDWSTRVIEGDYMRKAGWGKYVDNLPDKRYPFLVDTEIFNWHINPDGQRFPPTMPQKEEPKGLPTLGISVADEIGLDEKLI